MGYPKRRIWYYDCIKNQILHHKPTAQKVSFKIGEKISDPLSMYLADICTVPINIAGVPALSIPAGFSKNNLPIGLQLIGDYFSEAKILQAAYGFQKITDFHLQKLKVN